MDKANGMIRPETSYGLSGVETEVRLYGMEMQVGVEIVVT